MYLTRITNTLSGATFFTHADASAQKATKRANKILNIWKCHLVSDQGQPTVTGKWLLISLPNESRDRAKWIKSLGTLSPRERALAIRNAGISLPDLIALTLEIS